jgi:hypothetical protein
MLDFPNGWTASVQFGPGNYCSNRDSSRNPFSDHVQFLESNTAEVAAWPTAERESSTTRGWFQFEDGQKVKGWQDVDSVMEYLNKVSAFPNVLTAKDVQEASKKWKPILNDWGIDY